MMANGSTSSYMAFDDGLSLWVNATSSPLLCQWFTSFFQEDYINPQRSTQVQLVWCHLSRALKLMVYLM